MPSRFIINDEEQTRIRVINKGEEEYVSLVDLITYFKNVSNTVAEPNDKELIHTIIKILVRFKNRDRDK